MFVELLLPIIPTSFPFPFSPLILACSTFHFNESGIRLFECAIQQGHPITAEVVQEVVLMYSRLRVPCHSFTLLEELSNEQSSVMKCYLTERMLID